MTAILVDGGFYLKRAKALWGEKTPEDRANELIEYCHRHLKDGHRNNELYRIFYYDCPPATKTVFNPVTQKSDNLEKSDIYKWSTSFQNELKKKRKVALRLGRLSDGQINYMLKYETLKELCSGKRSLESLTQSDLTLTIVQKGVDMKIGLDISSIAFKKQANQIVLIAGDSDFVPAAKLARREGIDFILDPLWSPIKPELFEHIDGLNSKTPKPKAKVAALLEE